VRCEEVEVRHGLVRAGYQAVDLVGLERKERRVAAKLVGVRHPPTRGVALEYDRETLDRTQPPRDPR